MANSNTRLKAFDIVPILIRTSQDRHTRTRGIAIYLPHDVTAQDILGAKTSVELFIVCLLVFIGLDAFFMWASSSVFDAYSGPIVTSIWLIYELITKKRVS